MTGTTATFVTCIVCEVLLFDEQPYCNDCAAKQPEPPQKKAVIENDDINCI